MPVRLDPLIFRAPHVALCDDNVLTPLCLVINQMDTSQGHLSAKATSTTKDPHKPDNLSKDELTAVLKYGAQKMSASFVLFCISGSLIFSFLIK